MFFDERLSESGACRTRQMQDAMEAGRQSRIERIAV